MIMQDMVAVGDIVEIDMPTRPNWTGCLLKVEEVRTWGVTGSVKLYEGEAPLRVSYPEIEAVYRKVST